MAVGGGWGGYKMSISSNNAIDKQRQLKQAEVAEEQQKKQAGGGGLGLQDVQRGVWQVCA